MDAFLPRAAFPVVVMILGAVSALGLSACAPTDGHPAGMPNSLSQLPHKNRSLLKLGDTSRQAGDCAAALHFYQLVFKGDHNRREVAAAHLGAAQCALATGHMSAALNNYKAATKLAPHNPAPLVGMGRVYLIDHQPGRAVGYFDLAIKEGEHHAFIWNDKGVALDQLHRHKDAQQAYHAGLAHYPMDRALRNNLALSLAMSGDLSQAETILRQLVAEPGATARTRQNLSLVLGLEGNDSAARAVSRADLNSAALDNNQRFYDYARALLNGTPLPSPMADATPAADDHHHARHTASHRHVARTEPPLPPAVLVKTKPAPMLRADATIDEAPLDTPKSAPATASASPSPGASPTPAAGIATATPVAATPGAPTLLVKRHTTSPQMVGASDTTRKMPVAATQSVAAVPRATPVASSEMQE